jgi:predicted nucleic-acid-binding protein
MKPPAKAYLIDTNVILRYLLDDHETYSPAARGFMEQVAAGQLQAEIPAVVIAECVHVMDSFYKIPKTEIVSVLAGIINFAGIVNTDKSEILEALIHYENVNADIVDCILASKSSPQKPVVSFDRDFNKLKADVERLPVL